MWRFRNDLKFGNRIYCEEKLLQKLCYLDCFGFLIWEQKFVNFPLWFIGLVIIDLKFGFFVYKR
jgi:hypothetical protein